jgi:hypothetical protein
MSVSGGPDISEQGLVLALDAANIKSYSGSGATWTDLSGNEYNGTLISGSTFNGANGGSVVFDGVDDYVTLGNTLASSFSSNAVTVSCFARISAVVSKNTLISFNGGYNFFLPGNRLTTTYQLYWDGITSWKNGTKSDWTINQWYHFVWTISGTTLTFYVNGVPDGTTILATTFSPSAETRIGFANAGEYATGNIANLQVYNRALTPQEILQNFNAQRSRFGI